jgi:hypothetical protein
MIDYIDHVEDETIHDVMRIEAERERQREKERDAEDEESRFTCGDFKFTDRGFTPEEDCGNCIHCREKERGSGLYCKISGEEL